MPPFLKQLYCITAALYLQCRSNMFLIDFLLQAAYTENSMMIPGLRGDKVRSNPYAARCQKSVEGRVFVKAKYSLKKRIFTLWLCVVIVIAGLISLYAFQYARNSRNSRIIDTELLCSSYTERLNNDLHMMQEQISWYFASDMYYRQVSQGISDDLNHIRALTHIKNNLTTQAAILDFAGGYFFYDSSKERLRSAFHDFGTLDALQMNCYLKQYLEELSEKVVHPDYFIFGDCVYIFSVLSSKGCRIGYLLNLTDYFQLDDSTEMIYMQNGKVLESTGNQKIHTDNLLSEAGQNSARIINNKIIVQQPVPSISDLSVVLVRDYPFEMQFWEQWNFWMLILTLTVLTLLFSLFIYRTMRQTLLVPVQRILLRVNELKEDGTIREKTAFNSGSAIAEYQEINEKIDRIFLEMHQLEEDKLKEKMRANEAQLQYYQLQTNPHFYLNCLNTISTLLQNGKKEVANDMIIALSGHFRYMFRKSRSLVSLKEELEEVQDYCRIYNIRNGVPLLINIDVPENKENYGVPVLCIQTFVENSIKHYGKNEQMLRIRIQIREKQDQNGQKRLNIRVSDNGVGYTKENLAEFNEPVETFVYQSSHVGIDNLKYRLRLIYGEDTEIYFYNAPYGGAVAEMTIPAVEIDEVKA